MYAISPLRLWLCAMVAVGLLAPQGATWGPAFAIQPPSAAAQQAPNPIRKQEKAGRVGKAEKASKTVRDLVLWKILSTSEMHSQLTQTALEKFEDAKLKSYAQMLAEDHAELQQQVERAMRAPHRQPANSERAADEMPQVPAELCQILERASENTMTMLQEMLNAYEGQDFQMAFLGQQAVAQTILLAELNAMQSSTDFQDIKPIVQQAIAQTMRHLDLAKQLASEFEKDVKVDPVIDPQGNKR